jgi:carbonic anhydrase/acetyltransferase-like protein (isoleucine patch superfamily)
LQFLVQYRCARGDMNFIKMKQSECAGWCLFTAPMKYGTTIGNNVSIGHHAIVHGCTIHDNVLIGMGAIVMDNVEIHSNTIIKLQAL